MPDDLSFLLAQMRKNLGAHVAVGQCAVGQGSALWPEEAAAIARAVPARRAEFAAGRSAARAAMAGLEIKAAPVPMGADRAPIWPIGLCGSITHNAGHAIAIVARSGIVAGLGIDLANARDVTPEIAANVAFGRERAVPPALVFSAKEATYKALFPWTTEVWPFDAMEISQTSGGFAATLHRQAGGFSPGHTLFGHAFSQGDRILTVLVLPPATSVA